ncbi:unnamed protein product [Moneuplotes crassus]|uniref:Uncharacterized protein n=1 Tax=Euplotes crassus TaxID=5936 RepID=A0AAD1X4S2_EUPCR|nr:unnamed protein product [Moneuplotes crassus]
MLSHKQPKHKFRIDNPMDIDYDNHEDQSLKEPEYLNEKNDSDEPKIINVNLEDEPLSRTTNFRSSTNKLSSPKILEEYEKPKTMIKKIIKGKDAENFKNYEDYKPVSEVFGGCNQSPNKNIKTYPKTMETKYLSLSSINDGLLSPRDHFGRNKSSNFIVAPYPQKVRNSSKNLGGKVSPRTKIQTYATLSKRKRSPNLNRVNSTFSQEYKTALKGCNNETRRNKDNKKKTDFTLNYELDEVASCRYTDTQYTHKDLKRAKSTKRVGRMAKPLERKTNLYTSNGFSLAYLSPSKNQNLSQSSTIYKIQQSINKLDDRKNCKYQGRSSPDQPASFSSVYENKKKLNDYHRSMQGDKSTVSSKFSESRESEKSSMISSKNGKVNDYPYHGNKRIENFSQKLHTVSNARLPRVSKDSKSMSTNDQLRERLNKNIDDSCKSSVESRLIKENITSKKRTRKCNPKRIQKCKSTNENDIQDSLSMNTTSSLLKRKKSDEMSKVNNKSSYTSCQKERDTSTQGNRTDRSSTKKATSRLCSKMKSPRTKPSIGNNHYYTSSKPQNCTTKETKSTKTKLLEKNMIEKEEVMRKKEIKYISTIKQLDADVQNFKELSTRMQRGLQRIEEVVKKCNQFNLVFLNYYKDFEAFVQKEESKKVSFEASKYKPLQDQLQVCLNLCDFGIQEEDQETSKILSTELDELCKKYEENFKSNKDIQSCKLAKPKLSCDEFSCIVSSINEVENTNECSSPISVSILSSSNTESFSFNWGNSSQIDIELVKKDFIKLCEENKYLKKRIGNSSTVSDLKCEICPGYLEIIDRLTNEKDALESEIGAQISEITDKYEECETELKAANLKYEQQTRELLQKIEQEGELRSRVSLLEKRNTDLEMIIQKISQSKDGYEDLGNTVSDLSLALIGKNKKDLSSSQIQLIKNLFSDAQIKAVDGFKDRINTLEEEKEKIVNQSKFITSQNQSMLKPLRRYSIAIKECVELYKVLDFQNNIIPDSEGLKDLKNHAIGFIAEYEDNVNEVLPTLNAYTSNLKESIEEIGKYSNALEPYDENLPLQMCSPSRKSCQKFDYKQLNLGNPACSLDRDTENSMSRIEFSSVLQTDNQDVTPNKDLDESKNFQLSLIQSLNDFDNIDEDQEKLRDKKPIRKSKKKFKKKTAYEKRQQMIEETLEELDHFNKEEAPFEVTVINAQNKLIDLETNTIKEADERDEEDTQFDKDGNKILRSNNSLQGGSLKGKKSMTDILVIPGENLKYDIPSILGEAGLTKTQEISLDQLNSHDIHSLESESVKVEEDLLNDSIKFDENLL